MKYARWFRLFRYDTMYNMYPYFFLLRTIPVSGYSSGRRAAAAKTETKDDSELEKFLCFPDHSWLLHVLLFYSRPFSNFTPAIYPLTIFLT